MNYNNNLNTLIENISLDGTNINDLPKINFIPKKQEPINKNTLKSITDEIINNLRESSYDEESLDKSKKISLDDNIDDNIDEEQLVDNIKNKKKNKKKLDNIIKDNIENFIEDKIPVKNSKDILSYLFDDSFGIKDFILLFSIYFILSQDMIKDLFSSYFTCLNGDDEGKVGIKGVIVYGLILTIIFMLSKKYLV
jgi:hypothetical protein